MPSLSPEKAEQIDALLHHPAIFRFGDEPASAETVVSSGFAALDEVLGGGWPASRLIEVLCDRVGIGELSLLLPTLPRDHAGEHDTQNVALWIREPSTSTRSASVAYAPALDFHGVDTARLYFADTASTIDTLWVLEQALLSRALGHVSAWIRENPRDLSLRRIATAARRARSLCFLMRPTSAARIATPAELRIKIAPAAHGELEVSLLKRRGLLQEKKIKLQTRTLPCLAPDRQPIAFPGR